MAKPPGMCAKQSLQQLVSAASCRETVRPSLTLGNTHENIRSRYRVLRADVQRCPVRSVDRDAAGRNATSVKGSSPVKRYLPEWPSNYVAAKATLLSHERSTPGVQAHGMYRRQLQELGKTSDRQTRNPSKTPRQGFIPKSKVLRLSVLRCPHSSVEAE